MFDIFSATSAAVAHLKLLFPAEYRLGYTRNVSYYDTFNTGYEPSLENWDINGSVMWYLFDKKFFHELEFNSTKTTPSLNIKDVKGREIVGAMGSIAGIKDISPDLAQHMHEVRGISMLYGFYRNHPIDPRTSMYLGSCLGIVKVLGYQGFRKSVEDIYGLTRGIRLGISYSLNTTITAYMGYSYRKNTWKYNTDTIYDGEGDSITYESLDFEFASHGLEVGVRFSN